MPKGGSEGQGSGSSSIVSRIPVIGPIIDVAVRIAVAVGNLIARVFEYAKEFLDEKRAEKNKAKGERGSGERAGQDHERSAEKGFDSRGHGRQESRDGGDRATEGRSSAGDDSVELTAEETAEAEEKGRDKAKKEMGDQDAAAEPKEESGLLATLKEWAKKIGQALGIVDEDEDGREGESRGGSGSSREGGDDADLENAASQAGIDLNGVDLEEARGAVMEGSREGREEAEEKGGAEEKGEGVEGASGREDSAEREGGGAEEEGERGQGPQTARSYFSNDVLKELRSVTKKFKDGDVKGERGDGEAPTGPATDAISAEKEEEKAEGKGQGM